MQERKVDVGTVRDYTADYVGECGKISALGVLLMESPRTLELMDDIELEGLGTVLTGAAHTRRAMFDDIYNVKQEG